MNKNKGNIYIFPKNKGKYIAISTKKIAVGTKKIAVATKK